MERGELESLLEGLADRFPVHPVLAPPLEAPPRDGPISSAAVLRELLRRADEAPGPGWWLGVTARPLAGSRGERVFGEATVSGPAAVISRHPMRGPGEARRVLSAAVHELGHLAGVEHCADPGCVMYPSRSVGDTDRKGPDPCNACASVVLTFFTRRA